MTAAKKRGLGRGLEALLGPKAAAQAPVLEAQAIGAVAVEAPAVEGDGADVAALHAHAPLGVSRRHQARGREPARGHRRGYDEVSVTHVSSPLSSSAAPTRSRPMKPITTSSITDRSSV